ncbi:MAG: hypothetical protein WBN08_16890 [Thiogranum sp.]
MNRSLTGNPGIRERHLLRRKHNPLFDEKQSAVSNEDLARARLDDGLEMDRFMNDFQLLVQKAVDLKPNTPSETILEIKQELDRSYQQICALPGDQEHIKSAIKKLLVHIMQAIRAGAGNDAYAKQQLDDEETARKLHFELQELPLVAALTHPHSPIAEDELIPSLLSEPAETLMPSLQLFDENQIAAILSGAEALLKQRDPQRALADAWRGLELIETCYHDMQPDSAPGPVITMGTND